MKSRKIFNLERVVGVKVMEGESFTGSSKQSVSKCLHLWVWNVTVLGTSIGVSLR